MLCAAIRVGLVAAVVATTAWSWLAFCAPLTIDFSRWYARRTSVVAALAFVLAALGFWMGRQRILSSEIFEG